jgi:hypothetical protein
MQAYIGESQRPESRGSRNIIKENKTGFSKLHLLSKAKEIQHLCGCDTVYEQSLENTCKNTVLPLKKYFFLSDKKNFPHKKSNALMAPTSGTEIRDYASSLAST